MFSASKSSAPVSGGLLSKSLRFRSSATGYLNRTFGSGNQQKWTYSSWFKLGTLGINKVLISCGSGATDSLIYINSNEQLIFNLDNVTNRTPAMIFRDPSAWYHLVVALDTTNATTQNRVRIYINGVEITSWTINTAITQNATPSFNSAIANYISRYASGGLGFDGYMADVYWVDGQQLTPSSFGATDATTGQWSPAKYTGTYGTNGFHLTFANATSTTALGYDTSGNSNNWTATGISLSTGSTYDSMNDVPVAYSATASNYCVVNTLDKGVYITLADGNLKVSTATDWSAVRSTFGISSGKWYWEAYPTSSASGNFLFGISKSNANQDTGLGFDANGWAYYKDGQKYTGGAGSAYGASYANGDVIGIAFDADAGTLIFYKNGTSQGTAFTSLTSGPYFPAFSSYATAVSYVNFGQQPWQYSPPSGYNAVNTYNLPTPTIAQGNKYMDATTYTGNSSTQNIVNAGGFKPDLIWIKSRSGAFDNNLFDSVRSSGYVLCSNNASGESNYSAYFTGINSNGFSLASSTLMNSSSYTYVAWQWKAGGTVSAGNNTSGTITSTVSANTTAGFSVVSWVGNGVTSATVGHGLGAVPALIICKESSVSGDYWHVKHQSTPSNTSLYLNTTLQSLTAASVGDGMLSDLTSSTVFGFTTAGTPANVVAVNENGVTNVAYCFAQISGYSAFGSYTGNGSADGPFIYTGFRPAFIMIKVSSTTGNWCIEDNKREGYNSVNDLLYPNGSYAEDSGSSYPSDFVSNGFKTRNTSFNTSGATYIYMAFAENPFKYANAR